MDIEEVTADIDDLDLSDDNNDDVKDTEMAPAEVTEIEKYIAANRENTLQSLTQKWCGGQHDNWCEAARWIIYHAVDARESDVPLTSIRFRNKNGKWIDAEASRFGTVAHLSRTATFAEVQERAQKIVLAMKETMRIINNNNLDPGFHCVLFKCKSAVTSYNDRLTGGVDVEIIFFTAFLPVDGQI